MTTDPTTYDVVALMQGFPGRSTHHGGLGWSSVTALRGGDRLVVVDAGGFGARSVLVRRLADAGVDPDAVTDVLLTHAHYDHAGNYPLFTAAALWIGADELDWAIAQPPGRTPVPELYAADLAGNPRVRRIEESDVEILPGIRAVAAPGHTPGSRVYVVRGREGPVVFTGDAAKNRAELLSGEVDMTLDATTSRSTVERIRGLWREVPGTLLVPGHDLPMHWATDAPAPEYVGVRAAGIAAWYADDLASTTAYDLTAPPRPPADPAQQPEETS